MSSHYFSHDAYLQPGGGGGAAGLHSLDVTGAVSSDHEAPADGVADHLGADRKWFCGREPRGDGEGLDSL